MILMLLVKLLDVIDIPYETHTAVQAADQTAKMAVSSLGQVFVAVIAAFSPKAWMPISIASSAPLANL